MQEYIQVSSLEFHSIYMIYNYLIYKVEQTPYNALSVSCIKFLLTGVCMLTDIFAITTLFWVTDIYLPLI